MPTYDYSCRQCGHRFEMFLGINDNSEIKCPNCGGLAERQLSAEGGFILKGKGFYKTDYASQNIETCCSRGESCDTPKRCCEN
jgi:putative FmdB family regulatory protein